LPQFAANGELPICGMLRKCFKNLKTWGIDAGLVQGNAEFYAPPLKYIPGNMLDVAEYELLDRKFWMVAFQKPSAH